jgi:hypothetical protein
MSLRFVLESRTALRTISWKTLAVCIAGAILASTIAHAELSVEVPKTSSPVYVGRSSSCPDCGRCTSCVNLSDLAALVPAHTQRSGKKANRRSNRTIHNSSCRIEEKYVTFILKCTLHTSKRCSFPTTMTSLANFGVPSRGRCRVGLPYELSPNRKLNQRYSVTIRPSSGG